MLSTDPGKLTDLLPVRNRNRFGSPRTAPGLIAVGMLLLLCSQLVPGVSWAADIEVQPTDGRLALITVSGEIALSDGNRFAAVVAGLGQQRAAVVFGSPGGSLLAGLQIGQIISVHHYATFVPQETFCASACAFAWLSGTPRIMQEGGRIGFHAAYVNDGDAKVETGVGNALVGAYMTNLGLSVEAIIFLERAHPDEITWLTQGDAQRLGIAMKIVPSNGHPAHVPVTSPAAVAVKPASPRLSRNSSILTPELAEPQPSPQPTASNPNEQARSFAANYFTHWSEGNVEAGTYFSNTYAATVTYYGRTVDHNALLQTKQGYADRWPVRVYNVQPSTVRAFCNPANRICTVSGVVDWDCRDPARRAASKGSANFSFTIDMTGERYQILAESGSVFPAK